MNQNSHTSDGAEDGTDDDDVDDDDDLAMAEKDDSEESSSGEMSEDEKITDFQNKVKLTSPQKEFRFGFLALKYYTVRANFKYAPPFEDLLKQNFFRRNLLIGILSIG